MRAEDTIQDANIEAHIPRAFAPILAGTQLQSDSMRVFIGMDNRTDTYLTPKEGRNMSKEKFLTRRWNYIISLVQGVPTLAFVVYGLAIQLDDMQAGMITLAVLGSLF